MDQSGGLRMEIGVLYLSHAMLVLAELIAPGMCEHRFCSLTKTRGDRNCTACFSLANIFNQSTNKSFGAKLNYNPK